MATTTADIRIKGLGRKKLNELAQNANHLGMTPGRYVKQLVEEDLAISRAARRKTFVEILGPGREVDEAELDMLVDRARTEHYRKTTRRKR
jgi:hypothetical protein